jgi:hypothetical protein
LVFQENTPDAQLHRESDEQYLNCLRALPPKAKERMLTMQQGLLDDCKTAITADEASVATHALSLNSEALPETAICGAGLHEGLLRLAQKSLKKRRIRKAWLEKTIAVLEEGIRADI